MDAIRIGIALAFIGLMTILLRRLFAKNEWGILTCFSMAVAVYIACSFLRLGCGAELACRKRIDGMSDAPKKRLRAWIGWALVSILALYFLSAGPAFRLWSDGYIGSRIVNGVYAPLDWAYDHSTAVQRITDRYMRIWAPSDP